MAPLPKPTPHTVLEIYRAYAESNEGWDSHGLSVGSIGQECDRALFLDLRWASPVEVVDGRKVSIFRTGDMWEERMVADLAAIGVEVYGQQDRIRLLGGHIRGKIDGRGFGVPEAPKTEHLLEFKSSNAKGFREISKSGCREAKPLHFAQCQIGMHALGLTRAGYLVTNKDTDERYFERIPYDIDFCLRLLAKAERIITTDEPPSRVRTVPNAPPCLFCKHKPVCFEDRMPRATCRSCLHATPTMGGDADWSCARWNKPLSIDEQRAGCPAHLYLPGMVPGEQVSVDEESETVTYRLNNGREWVDGQARNEEATA